TSVLSRYSMSSRISLAWEMAPDARPLSSGGTWCPQRAPRPPAGGSGYGLFGLATDLLPVPLPGQGLLRPTLVPRLQVEAVLLDVLDDVFLLDLTLEAPKGIFYRLALLQFDLGQNGTPPNLW